MKINLTDIPVYIINLDKDVDKLASATSVLKHIGFKDIRRFPGYQIDTPKLGCATSHNALLQILSGHDMPVIVVEDDINVNYGYTKEFDIPDDADAVYLGVSKYGLYHGKGFRRISAEVYDENLYRLYNMLGAHAILYLNNTYPAFLTNATKAMMDIQDNQDKARASTMKFFNVYALDRPMFYQDNYNKLNTNFSISKYHSVVDKRHSI
jgi:hypothetical protein